jgi:hypothetical protein
MYAIPTIDFKEHRLKRNERHLKTCTSSPLGNYPDILGPSSRIYSLILDGGDAREKYQHIITLPHPYLTSCCGGSFSFGSCSSGRKSSGITSCSGGGGGAGLGLTIGTFISSSGLSGLYVGSGSRPPLAAVGCPKYKMRKRKSVRVLKSMVEMVDQEIEIGRREDLGSWTVRRGGAGIISN